MSKDEKLLLKVDDLCMHFDVGGRRVKASEHVSFTINKGEIFGLVGESGSGKSTIGKCIIGLNRATSGSITFHDRPIGSRPDPKIQMIFQDPMSSLNPKKQVGEIIGEALDVLGLCKSRDERTAAIKRIMERVGIPYAYANRYPKSFSGGQRQRIGIARALVTEPELIIADECIAALDASVQAQVVNMLREIRLETGTAFLFISHDLSMVRYLSDRIGVLHLGHMLEIGDANEVFSNPVHPYTRSLLAAIPHTNPVLQKKNDRPYDYRTSGIDYALGSWHRVSDNHMVWCTDSEYEYWREER
ncbi:MAG: ABC transporter ATP-binding protein [Eubacterium sp.]|nr:ABC transporter ATP-binding protein [Eubacterium sp.]